MSPVVVAVCPPWTEADEQARQERRRTNRLASRGPQLVYAGGWQELDRIYHVLELKKRGKFDARLATDELEEQRLVDLSDVDPCDMD